MSISLPPLPLTVLPALRAVTSEDEYLQHFLAAFLTESDRLARNLSSPAVACTLVARNAQSDDVLPALMHELHAFAHDNRIGKFNTMLREHSPDACVFSFRMDYGFACDDCSREYRLRRLKDACTLWFSPVVHDPGALVLTAPCWTRSMFERSPMLI